VALISQREYGRRRGVSGEAVRKRTATMGGPIPVHGPRKRIDDAEADRLWLSTMHPAGATTSRFQSPPHSARTPGRGAPAATSERTGALTRARTALLLTEAQIKRLRLEQRRSQLLDRDTVRAKFVETVDRMRGAWLAWPERVGPALAGDLGVDAPRLIAALERYVRRQLAELADVRLDLGSDRRPD
jgi:hypothetical protein